MRRRRWFDHHDDMTEITVPAPHVGCRQCARNLSAVLRDVPGVVSVRVDRVSESVTVSGDASQADLATALEMAGYVADTHRQERHP